MPRERKTGYRAVDGPYAGAVLYLTLSDGAGTAPFLVSGEYGAYKLAGAGQVKWVSLKNPA
jgi:hypothetical protein